MSAIIRIILGLIVMAVGFAVVWKTMVIYEWFGSNAWAEQKLGSSVLFYKLIGVLIAFIGIFIATNIISGILESFAGLVT